MMSATTRLTAATRRRNGGATGWPKIQTGMILFAVYLVSKGYLVEDQRGIGRGDRLPGHRDRPDLTGQALALAGKPNW